MATKTAFDRYSLAILATTLLWGTFWIPLRQLDLLGGGSILYIGTGFLLPFLVLLPLLIKKRRQLIQAGTPLVILGLSFAIAGSFYAEGTLRGNVARVILLFYLTPVWSTLLARVFLKEPITRRRMVTLVLGLLGMSVILGNDSFIPIPSNISEWFGVIAGFSWGVAMVCAQRLPRVGALECTGVIFFFFPLVFVLLTLVPGGRTWSFNPELVIPITIAWILALAFIWNLPSAALTMFGAVEVEPGKVAILLMLEVIIGVSTASLLTNEPFGSRELIGAILIVCAGITEFIPFGKSATIPNEST